MKTKLEWREEKGIVWDNGLVIVYMFTVFTTFPYAVLLYTKLFKRQLNQTCSNVYIVPARPPANIHGLVTANRSNNKCTA